MSSKFRDRLRKRNDFLEKGKEKRLNERIKERNEVREDELSIIRLEDDIKSNNDEQEYKEVNYALAFETDEQQGCFLDPTEENEDEDKDNILCNISQQTSGSRLGINDKVNFENVITQLSIKENIYTRHNNSTYIYLKDNIDTLLSTQIKLGCGGRISSRNILTIEGYLHSKISSKISGGSYLYFDKNVISEGSYAYTYVIFDKLYKHDFETWLSDLNNNYKEISGNPLELTEYDLLILFYYGIKGKEKNTVNGLTYIYKVKKPEPKQRRIASGNTTDFNTITDCQVNSTGDKCKFSRVVNKLFNELDKLNDNGIIRDVILWIDTHHDFKKARFEKAINVWNQKMNNMSFIQWYSDQFFIINNSKDNEGIYNNIKFSSSVKGTILGYLYDIIKNDTVIPSLLYTLSVNHLREKDFEKSILLMYITKYYLRPSKQGSGKEILRDILYVEQETIVRLFGELKNDNKKLKALEEFYTNFEYGLPTNLNAKYIQDAGQSNVSLKGTRKVVPSALFDANNSNTPEPYTSNNTTGRTVYDDYKQYSIKPVVNKEYKYNYNSCKLEVTSRNTALTKADVRCSSFVECPIVFGGEVKNKATIIEFLKSKGIEDPVFIDKMYDTLTKFVGANNNFSVSRRKKAVGYDIINPEYFNSIKTGPSVQELVFLTIFYLLENKNKPLFFWDDILSLKRIGDYGQVIDARDKGFSMFTTDSMECLMCLIENTSCIINFNQGVILYDGDNDRIYPKDKNKNKYKSTLNRKIMNKIDEDYSEEEQNETDTYSDNDYDNEDYSEEEQNETDTYSDNDYDNEDYSEEEQNETDTYSDNDYDNDFLKKEREMELRFLNK
jgi:hypothetical protein